MRLAIIWMIFKFTCVAFSHFTAALRSINWFHELIKLKQMDTTASRMDAILKETVGTTVIVCSPNLFTNYSLEWYVKTFNNRKINTITRLCTEATCIDDICLFMFSSISANTYRIIINVKGLLWLPSNLNNDVVNLSWTIFNDSEWK